MKHNHLWHKKRFSLELLLHPCRAGVSGCPGQRGYPKLLMGTWDPWDQPFPYPRDGGKTSVMLGYDLHHMVRVLFCHFNFLSLLDHTESSHGDSCVLNHLNPCESPFAHKDSSFQLWPFTRWESLARGEQQFVSITLIFRVILWAVGPPPDPASIFLLSAHRGLTCVDTTRGLRGPWLPAGFGREPLR